MAYVYGNSVVKSGGNPWKTFISYSTSQTDTTYTVSLSMGMYPYDGWIKTGTRKYTLSGTGKTTKTDSETNVKVGNQTHTAKISATWSWDKGTSSATKTITAKTVYSGSNQDGTSTATLTVTVPALTKHTVSYSANGGSPTPSSQTKYYGINITLASAISKTGYKFNGWKGSGATTSTYSAGATYSVNSTTNTTMTAQWTANTYYVKFNANGGSGTMSNETFTYGTPKALTSNAFTKTGYHFDGWNTKADGTGTSYSNGASVTNLTSTSGGTVNLYAKWAANTYTVHYNSNASSGISGSTADSSHTYDTAKNLTTNGFTRTNYDFKGWATSSTGSVVYTNGQSVKNLTTTNNGTVNLYAVWDLGYKVPTFSQNTISVYRCNSNGDLADEGTYGYIYFEWTDGEYPVGTALDTTPLAEYRVNGSTGSWTSINGATIDRTNNSYTVIFGGSLPIENQYDVRLYLSDTINGVTYTTDPWEDYISAAVYTMDINEEGTAVSFFAPASDTNTENILSVDGLFRVTDSGTTSGQKILVQNGASGIDTFITAKNTDSGTDVRFGVGGTGYNHGIYSQTVGGWIISKQLINDSDPTEGWYTTIGNPTGSIYARNTSVFGGQTTGGTNVILCGMNSSNHELFGSADYPTYIRGSSIYIQGSSLVDFVIEQGTKSGTASGAFSGTVTWYYRKWKSGKVEAWGNASGSCALGTSDGGGYRSAWLTVSFPSGMFSSAPKVWCSAYNAATSSAIGSVVGGSPPSSTSTGSWAMYRITQITTAQTRVFEFYCKQE